MNFEKKLRITVAKLNEDKSIKELTAYDLMFWLNTSRYEVITPILRELERRNIIKKKKRGLWIVVGREE